MNIVKPLEVLSFRISFLSTALWIISLVYQRAVPSISSSLRIPTSYNPVSRKDYERKLLTVNISFAIQEVWISSISGDKPLITYISCFLVPQLMHSFLGCKLIVSSKQLLILFSFISFFLSIIFQRLSFHSLTLPLG